MVVATKALPPTEERLMLRRMDQSPAVTTTPESFLQCLNYFLTPQVWKQALQAVPRRRAWRWQTQPLLFVLLCMTWCAGDSLPERFETARAFYVALHQRRRRPGKTFAGFEKALGKLPVPVLRAVAAAVRCRLAQVFDPRLWVNGFIPLGCDGSRLACPRSAELERRLRLGQKHKGQKRQAPHRGAPARFPPPPPPDRDAARRRAQSPRHKRRNSRAPAAPAAPADPVPDSAQ